ncbi:hypothetical protein [Burkholderia pseudomallei]|uniref:hypothetical protein n=1 Tax=Burkholderia pseudomallei TaxID=28450 RepID=UPI0009B5707F|nr:hypothetical protein [Burkholderia pseudomallei]
MATCNSTLAPVEGLSNRAGDELRAASDALYRTSVLLATIENELMDGATISDARVDIFALVKIALEIAKTSADRAEGEADFFAATAS